MIEYSPYFSSMLFTMALVIYSLLMTYLLYLERKTALNWLFALVCLSMVVWSFGYTISVSAESLFVASRWQRVAVWGYGTIYSLILHFAIILTKNDRFFKNRSTYLLIYLPAVINLLLYSIKTPWFSYDYNLIQTRGGWVTLSNRSPLNTFFYVYVLVFVLLTLYILVGWRLKSQDEQDKRQFKIVFTAFLLVLSVGLMNDVILPCVLNIPLPKIAPLLMLLPLMSVLYASIRYGLMNTEMENKETIVLQSGAKSIIYKYIAMGFAIGGIMAFLSEFYLTEDTFGHSLTYGIIVAMFGFALNQILRSEISEVNKDNLILLVISLVVPLVMFNSIDSGGITVWVVSFLLVIVFMLYNNGKMLIAISLTTMLTLVVAFLIMPEVTTVVNQRDFGYRLVFLGIGTLFALSSNHIYLNRLRMSEEQLRDQQMIAEVSSEMVSAVEDNFDEKLNQVLALIGRRYYMDRAYYFSFSEDGKTMTNSHEWCNAGIAPEMVNLANIPTDVFPWWMKELRTKKVVTVPDVASLPEEAQVEKEELMRQSIKSTMAVSVFLKDRQIGYMGLDVVKSKMFWRDDIILNMKIIGNVISDAFTKNNAEKTIHQLAYYDQLTGLPSRLLFKDRLFQAMKRADRTGDKLAVALLDLDAFKVINDTLGHDKGDLLLINVARRLENAVRNSDTVCRFGGDEFLLLCNGLQEVEDALVIGDEVIASFKPLFDIGQDEVNVSASLGIAIYPEDGQTADQLIKNADIAMYHAKDSGKNTFAMCNDQLKDQTIQTARLTNALFKAMENDELFMCYQPQVELTSNRITGVEALIRWRHKDIGLIAPAEFIHIAERNGYILEIGEWVLRRVFEEVQSWSRLGYDDFVVAINVSFIQMQNNDFVELIHRLLDTYAIEPHRIELEITESIAMNQKGDISGKLEALRNIGIQIAIDDFGTEYSSLGRLKDLTVDKIKIARPFIEGITKHSKDEAIIKSIIALAKNLDIQTIAEGVESHEQLGFLNDEACDYIQGYLYFKPMLADEVTQLLRRQDQ